MSAERSFLNRLLGNESEFIEVVESFRVDPLVVVAMETVSFCKQFLVDLS